MLHHSLEPVRCTECSTSFSRHDLLVRHVKLFHAGVEPPKAPAAAHDSNVPAPLPVPKDGQALLAQEATSMAVQGSAATIVGVGHPPSSPSARPRTASSPASGSDLPRSDELSEASNPSPSPSDADLEAFLQSLASPSDPAEVPRASLDLPLPAPTLPSQPSLAIGRPLNWAVHALPGTEEDWKDEEEASGASGPDCIIQLLQRSKEPGMYSTERHVPPPPPLPNLFSIERGQGSRFFMGSQRFCTAYLYPWEIPPLPRLSRFAAQTYVSLLPVVPLIHRPTMILQELAPPFAFALSVVGAGFFESYSDFHNELSHQKRDFAAEHLSGVVVHEAERLPCAQTLLLYNLVGAFHDSSEERNFTRKHHPQLIQAFLDIVPPTATTPPDLDLPAKDLERAWLEFVERETYIRVAFLCYLVDIQTGASFGEGERLLSHSHPALADLPLPAPDALWNASSATEWRDLMQRATPSTVVSFRDALNALLSRSPPKHTSPAARILSTLSFHSSFTLTILSQTLASLSNQIAASQRLLRGLAGPPSSTVGGELFDFGVPPAVPHNDLFQAAATSAQESMARINFGQRVLRVLGGTTLAGPWFSGITPIFQ
ncbi:hypothetical protein JCM10213_002872 [Rhodosporidiobolus nylandii]